MVCLIGVEEGDIPRYVSTLGTCEVEPRMQVSERTDISMAINDIVGPRQNR
jgi:hypothetical protein